MCLASEKLQTTKVYMYRPTYLWMVVYIHSNDDKYESSNAISEHDVHSIYIICPISNSRHFRLIHIIFSDSDLDIGLMSKGWPVCHLHTIIH
jgi:hypothetical protein